MRHPPQWILNYLPTRPLAFRLAPLGSTKVKSIKRSFTDGAAAGETELIMILPTAKASRLRIAFFANKLNMLMMLLLQTFVVLFRKHNFKLEYGLDAQQRMMMIVC